MLREVRGIFIRNLSYKITLQELGSLLNTVGRPVHYNLHRDPRTGTFKGVATAEFCSQPEAQYAAASITGRRHMGMTLEARLESDPAMRGRVEPMVVDGSSTFHVQNI